MRFYVETRANEKIDSNDSNRLPKFPRFGKSNVGDRYAYCGRGCDCFAAKTASRARLGVTDPGKNAKSLREFEIASFVPSREFRADSRKPSFCRTSVTSASRVRTRRDSRMADIEDNTASARAKRPAGIASAAGRRERRAPASKVRAASVNIKPPVFVPAEAPRARRLERRRRRARDARDADAAPSFRRTLRAIAQDLDIVARQAHAPRRPRKARRRVGVASDHSEDTGIEGTDALRERHRPTRFAGKAAPRWRARPHKPTPRRPRAGAAGRPPRPRRGAREGGEGDRAGEEEGEIRALHGRGASRFSSARPTTSSCASQAMRAEKASGGARRATRPDRRAACLVVDFRDRAAPRASTRRAPRAGGADDHLDLSPRAPRDLVSSSRRLPIARTAARFNWERYTHAVAPGARDASQRDTGVRLGHVRLAPGTSTCDRRAPHAQTRDVWLFRCFSRTARPRVVANTKTSRRVARNAIVGRVGARPRQRALDRARSVACASAADPMRWIVVARAARRRKARRRSRRSGLVRRVRRVARNNTARRRKVKPRRLGTLQAHSKNEKRKTERAADADVIHGRGGVFERAHAYSART